MIFDSYLSLPEGIPSKSIVHLSTLPHFSLEFCPCQALAGKDYDLIYDCVGTPEDWPKAAKVLKKGGGCRWRQFFPSWEWNINIFLKMVHTFMDILMVDFPRQVRSSETPWDFVKTVETCGYPGTWAADSFAADMLLGSFGISQCPCILSIVDGLTFVEVLSNTSFFRSFFCSEQTFVTTVTTHNIKNCGNWEKG